MLEFLGALIAIAAILVGGLAHLWFIFNAFRESILWGLACLFLPFAWLFFAIFNWDEAKTPFLLYLASVPVLLVGYFTMSLGAG